MAVGKRRRMMVALAAALVGLFVFAASSPASSRDRRVRIKDDCDAASFNAFGNSVGLGNLCAGQGDTTFADFIAQVTAHRPPHKWRFDRKKFNLKAGGKISVVNKGGEFHTFTEVAHFGGGCFKALNDLLGLTPVPECGGVIIDPPNALTPPAAFGTSGVAPLGGTLTVTGLSPGIHRFECLIHPWMRSTVRVRSHH